MANILFVTWDGGGNLPPALGIAAELRDRGEQVRFLGHEQQREAIESTGLRFESYQHARPWSSTAQAGGLRGAATIFSMFTDRGPGQDLLASIGREPADLVVIDCMLLGALHAADRAGLRRAVLVHTFYQYLAGRWSRGPAGIAGRLKGQHPVRLWSAADLVLIATLADLDPASRRPLPDQFLYTGPVVRVRDPGPVPRPGDSPQVLVSLSTIYYPGQMTALQSILDALADLPVRAVVTTGPAIDPSQLRPPGNAQLHRYLPHDQLMPQVALVISHGGHATIMRALAHNRPALIMPMHPMLDQPMIAKAVQEQGAATVVPKTAAPTKICDAIQPLLAAGPHRHAAEQLGATIRGHDAAATAADRLTALLPSARKPAGHLAHVSRIPSSRTTACAKPHSQQVTPEHR
jgi:UDP:flavonoid glycosyltransferase YjiC (YdhE family)